MKNKHKKIILLLLSSGFLFAENYYKTINLGNIMDESTIKTVDNIVDINKVYDNSFPLYKVICVNCYTSQKDFIIKYRYTTLSYSLMTFKYKDSFYDNGTSLMFSSYLNLTNLVVGFNYITLTKSGDTTTYKQIALNPDIYVLYKNLIINPYYRFDHSKIDKNKLVGLNMSYYVSGIKSTLKLGYGHNNYTDIINNKRSKINQYFIGAYKYFNFNSFYTTFGLGIFNLESDDNYHPVDILLSSNYKNYGVYTNVILGKYKNLALRSGKILYDGKEYKKSVTIGFNFKIQENMNSNLITYYDHTANGEKTYGIGINLNYSF